MSISAPAPAWVALGTNLGDRRATLARALTWLASLPETTLEASSSFYRTPPLALGRSTQPDFLNAVARLRTSLPPRRLLAALQSLEHAAGRTRTIIWGPRTLDLDLLLMGDRVLTDGDLTLPHPRLLERAFVLVPLAAIDPELVHPLSGRTIAAHLAALPRDEASCVMAELL